MVQKLVSRDTLNYRKITDKPQPEKKEAEEKKEGETATATAVPALTEEEKMETDGEAAPEVKQEIPDDETLAQGRLGLRRKTILLQVLIEPTNILEHLKFSFIYV